MAYSDPVTLADHWADSKARWQAMPATRRLLICFEIAASVAMLWSVLADPGKPLQTVIWIVWAVAMIVGTVNFFRDAAARRRAEQTTLEGTEQ